MVTLVFNDGRTFDLDVKYVNQIKVLNDLFADVGETSSNSPVPIPCEDVSPEMMRLIVSYLDQYPNEPEDVKHYVLDDWSNDFFKDINYQTVERLIKGANYLAVAGLVERCAVRIAEMMRGKSIAELKELFGREIDPEFEQELKSEDWNFV